MAQWPWWGGEVMALVPDPPTPLRRAHQLKESRQERLVRWRFDALIAGTALVANLPLIPNNAADFEAIRAGVEGSRAVSRLGCIGAGAVQSVGVERRNEAVGLNRRRFGRPSYRVFLAFLQLSLAALRLMRSYPKSRLQGQKHSIQVLFYCILARDRNNIS